jgi:hypothetical protein
MQGEKEIEQTRIEKKNDGVLSIRNLLAQTE